MAFYSYQALRRDGKKVKGTIDAASMFAARESIVALGLYPIRIELGAVSSSWSWKNWLYRTISVKDKIFFTKQIVETVFEFARKEWHHQTKNHSSYKFLYKFLCDRGALVTCILKPYSIYSAEYNMWDWEFDVRVELEFVSDDELAFFSGEERAHLMSDVHMILLYMRALLSELLRTHNVEHDSGFESSTISCVFDFAT